VFSQFTVPTVASVERAHRGALRARNGHAVSQLRAGNAAGVETFLTDLLMACRRHLGVDDPDTLVVGGNLAVCRFQIAPGPGSVELIEDAVRDRIRVLGSSHPMVLAAAEAMATALRECGRLAEAEDLSTEVVASRIRHLGHIHPDTLMSRLGLALVHVDLGELYVAAGELSGIDDDTVRSDPAVRSTALAALGHLAWCYSGLGWTTLARDVAWRVTAESITLFGAPDPLVRGLA
jgi:Tetratricopeptide repeat